MRFLQLAGKSYAKYFKIDIFIKQFNGNLIRKLLHIDSVLNGINFNDFSFVANLYRFLSILSQIVQIHLKVSGNQTSNVNAQYIRAVRKPRSNYVQSFLVS